MAGKKVFFHPAAEIELEEAAAWYEERHAGLGLQFVRAVHEKARQVAEASHRWPEHSSTRRVVMGRFPYWLVYREVREVDIEILAIAHMKRRPSYWARR